MKTLTKIISGIVIGGTLISATTIAMADSKDNPAPKEVWKNPPNFAGKMFKGGEMGPPAFMKGTYQEGLKVLVDAGIITQDESDKIQALAEKRVEERKTEFEKVRNMTREERKVYLEEIKGQAPKIGVSIFDDAVNEGIISQEKADAARSKLEEIHRNEMQSKITAALNGLVQKGTITQNQMDKVLEVLDTEALDRKAEFDKIRDMTDEQRREYMESKKGEWKAPFSKLIDDGTFTTEQLQEVRKALPMGGFKHKGGPKGPFMNGSRN